MLHPSYLDLIDVANENVEEGQDPVVTSRYSIILAAARRARQLVDGATPIEEEAEDRKPLSIAVDELYHSRVHILPATAEDLMDDEPGAELKAGMSQQDSWSADPESEYEDSTTGNSGCLLCWPREVQSSIRVAKESWGLLSSDCRANRPHLGLCPEANVPLQGRQGSRGCIPDAPGETGIPLEWKQRTPLCSRIATGISWSSLGGLKGVKPPEAFGERSRDWSLGHAGDEGPHLAMTGESWGCSRAAAPVCAFSRGTTARSVSLSWGAREVGSPCEWRGRAPHCSRAMVGCRGPAPADPGYSKERRRRRRSGNHCLIKC